MKIDITKPVQTKNGLKARIVESKMKSSLITMEDALVVVVTFADGTESVYIYRTDGRRLYGSFDDDFCLINVPEEVTQWINIYEYDNTYKYYPSDTRKLADARGSNSRRRVACIPVTFKKGDGL